MRWAAPLALALLMSCDDPPLPPGGALSLPRDGMLRAGGVQVENPVAVFQARSAGGAVVVEFDPGVTVESAARLLGQAGEAGLARLDITGTAGFAWLLGKPGVKPPVPGVPAPLDVTRTAGEAELVARPSKAELRVRLSSRTTGDHAKAIGEAASAMAAELPATVAIVVAAPRGSAWSRVRPHVQALSAALGDRVVRYELVPE